MALLKAFSATIQEYLFHKSTRKSLTLHFYIQLISFLNYPLVPLHSTAKQQKTKQNLLTRNLSNAQVNRASKQQVIYLEQPLSTSCQGHYRYHSLITSFC